MPAPMRVDRDACLLQRRFLLDPTLVRMVQALDEWARRNVDTALAGFGVRWPGLSAISGHRTREVQASVNPDAPDSLHTRCPSLAIDLRMGAVEGVEADAVWEWLGARWKQIGGRWGGDFSPGRGPDGVNRREQNHFDLGVGST